MAKYEFIDKDDLCFETVTTDDYSGNEILDVVLKEDIDNMSAFTEQDIVKPILDKIREEVESIEHYGTNNGQDFWLRTPNEIKKDVLAILDKYKAESEDT